MRTLTLALAAFGALLIGAASSASAGPMVDPGQPQKLAVETVQYWHHWGHPYYWHHNWWRHRYWRDHHWRYYN